jgi:hypothetical protein
MYSPSLEIYIYTHERARAHTHTYIYIYMIVCVFVCLNVCFKLQTALNFAISNFEIHPGYYDQVLQAVFEFYLKILIKSGVLWNCLLCFRSRGRYTQAYENMN